MIQSLEFTLEQKIIYDSIAKTAHKRLVNTYPRLGPYIHWFDVLKGSEIRELKRIGW